DHSILAVSLAKVLVLSRYRELVSRCFTRAEKRRSPFRVSFGQDGGGLGRVPLGIIGRSVPGPILSRIVDPLDCASGLDRDVCGIKSKSTRRFPLNLAHLNDDLIGCSCLRIGSGGGAGNRWSRGNRRRGLLREEVLEIHV